MIISDRYRFAFIHIPKCAGTYVRKKLEAVDDTAGLFAKPKQHPALGLLDYAHIPLHVLQQHFTSEFERVHAYSSFAVLRDPFDRFPSSIAQRLRMYRGIQFHTASGTDLRQEIDAAIDYLSQTGSVTDPTYIHFARQSDFVELGDAPVVKNLYAVDDVGPMLRDISGLIGMELVGQDSIAQRNQTISCRNRGLHLMIEALQPILGDAISTLLPKSAKKRIREFVYPPRKQNTPDIFKSEVIKNFVRDYYRRDIDLHERAKSREQTAR